MNEKHNGGDQSAKTLQNDLFVQKHLGQLFDVDETGKVFIIMKDGPRPAHTYLDQSGYVRYTCVHKGHRYRLRVHRMVLIKYRGLAADEQECDHIDFNRSNNNLENLRWVTRSENTVGRKRGTPRFLTDEEIETIRRKYKEGRSIGSLAREYGASHLAVKKRLHNDYKKGSLRLRYGKTGRELAEELNVHRTTIHYRERNGLDIRTGEKIPCASS